MSKTAYELIIVGGGPAGLTAGIYAARARLRTVLIEKMPLPGGLAATTHQIENYPGYEKAISGSELTQRMAEQAKHFGLEIVNEEAVSSQLRDAVKTVTTSAATHRGKAVIIASGTTPKILNVPGETNLRGKGVSYCATCDGPLFKDKDVVVVGAGNSGLQESLFLARYVKHIHVVEMLAQPTGEKILQERLQANPNVTFYLNHMVAEIRGDKKVSSVLLKKANGEEEFPLEVQGVFIYAGMHPCTEWLGAEVSLDERGCVITDEELKTSREGVFAAGDVRRKVLRQVVTAVGDGALAAFMSEQYLNAISPDR